MIQRLQTLWLLLAAIFAFLTFSFPFYSGNVTTKDNIVQYTKLTASYHFVTLILTGALILGCLIIIFLYKNRKMQLRLTILALIISIINIIFYFSQIKNFIPGNLSFAAVISLVIPILLFLAARGIWKDEKLVKSLDRLR